MRFLEVGCDLERGVDDATRAWVGAGHPTTYHFLDANLEEGDDLDDAWVAETAALARSLGAAWLCGDAGLWHVGPRDRGHGVLLPPILTAVSARALADNVRRLREASGLEVLPENPPAHVYVGDLSLLDYFARVAEDADCGVLLDVAHLAIHQRATGRRPLDGLADFPLERVVEVHVAGASEFAHAGRRFVDDDHSPEPLPDTWEILDYVLPRATALRAVVFECERNRPETVAASYERLVHRLETVSPRPAKPPAAIARDAPAPAGIDRGAIRAMQRTLVRMQHDAGFAARLAAGDATAAASAALPPAALAWMRALDLAAVSADRDGRRAEQLLRNVSSEFRLCTALGPAGDDGAAWLARFPATAWFHAAIAADESLPLAFARYVEASAAHAASAPFRAFAALETAMARARRADAPPRPPPPAGAVRLAPTASLATLPAGTHACAAQWHAGEEIAAGPPALDLARIEHVLLVRDAAPARFGRLPALRVEPLAPLVADFLAAAGAPLDGAALARFGAAHGLAPDELADVVDEYVAEGVLLRG